MFEKIEELKRIGNPLVSNPQIVENPRKARKGYRLFHAAILVGGVPGEHGADLSEENCFLTDFAAEMRRIPAKSDRESRSEGTCSPVPLLFKTFLTNRFLENL